jgi:hypothetical protein
VSENALKIHISQSLVKGLVCLALGATFGGQGTAFAQTPVSPPVDRRPLEPSPKKSAEPEREESPWQGSTLSWNNSATTETLGVGQDVQSENPTYEMAFGLAPRYTFWRAEGNLPRTVSVGARLELIREFTNSDDTTRRGEWMLSNLAVAPQYSHSFYKRGDYETSMIFRAPALSFPTSKASSSNGTILGLGAILGGSQKLPLLGSDSSVLQSLGLTGRMGFEHVFRRTTTPTNPDIERERMGPDGETLPNDQLSGRAFTEREIVLGLGATIGIHERVRFTNLFEWHLAWKYRFEENTRIDLATGEVSADRVENPDRFGVIALFASEVAVTVVDELDIEVGYQNLAPQVGPDAQRRNVFYSPNARFSLTLVGNLDAIYDRLAGNTRAGVTALEHRAPGASH